MDTAAGILEGRKEGRMTNFGKWKRRLTIERAIEMIIAEEGRDCRKCIAGKFCDTLPMVNRSCRSIIKQYFEQEAPRIMAGNKGRSCRNRPGRDTIN